MGQTIAVLDTGVDKRHPFLSGKIVSEACYSTTNVGSQVSSVCPGGVQESTAPGSGVPCDLSISGCYHGTHVAGAWAVLRSAVACTSVDQILSALTTTGVPISTIRRGYPTITKPRIRVNDARLALPTQSPGTLQFDATTYTMSENGPS